MYDTRNAAVHLHYWTSDEEMDKQGWGQTDLVCHGCGQSTRVLYPAVTEAQADAEPLRPIRDAFVHDHHRCAFLGGTFLCPPEYVIHETRDLRDAVWP